MALEQLNYSQVITYPVQNVTWSSVFLFGGEQSSGSADAPWTGYGNMIPGAPQSLAILPGDKFQLYTSGGSLKEATIFTVAYVGHFGFGLANVYFTPRPQVAPANGDRASAVAPVPLQGKWLGALGHVSGLTRGYTCPGGPDTLSLLLRLPANYRTDAINPGRLVQAWRGASCVWEGKLDEPTPGPDGWTVTAHGSGTFGSDFAAMYTTWNADDAVNQAIQRGLRWTNPGIGSPSGIYLAQQQDSGSETVTAHLDLLITGGGLLWMVSPGIASAPPAGPWSLAVTPFSQDANGNPTRAPDRILVSSTPVARTIAADVNRIIARFQLTADTAGTSTKKAQAAVFEVTSASNPTSVAAHGPMEYYIDLSSAGVLSASQAQAIAANILNRYLRASWAGPFTASPGQVRNAGGQPVDLGADQAGLVYQVMVTDAPYGGEVVAAPLLFLSGAYEYDEDSQTATITPYQSARQDISSLISSLYPDKF